MGGIGSKQHTDSSNRGCACLGGAVAPPLGVVKEEVAVLVVLVRRHCCVVGAAVRQAVDDEENFVIYRAVRDGEPKNLLPNSNSN